VFEIECEVFSVLSVAHVCHCSIAIFSILHKQIGAFDTIWHEFNNSDNSHFQFLITVELPESHQTVFHAVLCEQWNVTHFISCQQPNFTAVEFFKLVSKWDRCINNGVMDNVEK
jgi:hypothetical protein